MRRNLGPDTRVHPPFFQVCEIIESPLFLKLNPMTKHTDVSTVTRCPLCPACCYAPAFTETSLLTLLLAVYHL